MKHAWTCRLMHTIGRSVLSIVHALCSVHAQIYHTMHITVDKELLTDGCTNILSVHYSVANNDAHSTTCPVTVITLII